MGAKLRRNILTRNCRNDGVASVERAHYSSYPLQVAANKQRLSLVNIEIVSSEVIVFDILPAHYLSLDNTTYIDETPDLHGFGPRDCFLLGRTRYDIVNHSIGELSILTVDADLRRCHLLWKGDGHPTACLILQGLPQHSERPLEILVLSAGADNH